MLVPGSCSLSCWLSFAILFVGSLNGRPLVKADADFLSVRTRLKKDHSGKGGDPPAKYFRESSLLSSGEDLGR